MNKKNKLAVLYIHHCKNDVTLHNYDRLKRFNPDVDIYTVGFEWHDLIEGSHVVRRNDELPNNYILNNILKNGTSSESDLCLYDFFLYHQDYDSYFVIEWDTYCNASIHEVYGEVMKQYNTFSANIFTNEISEVSKNEKFDLCVVCESVTDTEIGTNVHIRNNYIDGVGQFCKHCYDKVDRSKYIEVKPKRTHFKEWSWYKYFFSKLNEPTEQKQLLPYLGGTYPTSLLYYTNEVLHNMVKLVLENPRLYDNIQNEMRLGTLLQYAGYRLESYGANTNQFCEGSHYRSEIKNNVKGYYHPIKVIL
jgi:hypothetical protein